MSELTEYFARHYTLVIDNDQGSYLAAQRITQEAIKEESPDLTRGQYLAMSVHERESEFAYAIGAGILALVEEATSEVLDEAEHYGSLGQSLLSEIRITDGFDLAYALGCHYLPEDSDVDFLDEEESE